MLHGFDERLRDISAGDPVPRRQWQGVLPDDDRVLPGRPIEQEAHADNRVVQAAGTNFLLNAPAPDERVPLEQVDQHPGQRGRRDADRVEIDEAALESGLARGRNRVHHALIVGRLD